MPIVAEREDNDDGNQRGTPTDLAPHRVDIGVVIKHSGSAGADYGPGAPPCRYGWFHKAPSLCGMKWEPDLNEADEPN